MKQQLYLTLLLSLLLSCSSSNKDTLGQKSRDQNDLSDTLDNIDTLFVDGFDYPIGDPNGKGKYVSKVDGKEYDSWYNSTGFLEPYDFGIHPGIDLNGTGGGNTDLGQPVYSIGKGIVIDATDYGAPWGNIVMVKHKYFENGDTIYCYSMYAHLEELQVKKEELVKKRQQLGVIGTGDGSFSAHLHLEIRKGKMKELESTYWPSTESKDEIWVKDNYESPEEFIKSHRVIKCP